MVTDKTKRHKLSTSKRGMQGGPDEWEVKFELPECLCPENLEPANLNKIKVKDGLYLAEDKAPNIDVRAFNNHLKQEIGKIEINFTDNSDELEEYKSIRRFMDEWIERCKPDFEEEVVNFFTLFENDDEHSDNTNRSYRLKKPISKMTDEEKDFLREMLGNFGVTDLSYWGL